MYSVASSGRHLRLNAVKPLLKLIRRISLSIILPSLPLSLSCLTDLFILDYWRVKRVKLIPW